MSSEIDSTTPKLVIEYKNKQPLDLLELTASLTAVGEQFRRFAASEMPNATNARLRVGRMRDGSTIAELIGVMQIADWVRERYDLVTPFAAQFGDVLNLIRTFPPKARELEKSEVRAAKAFVTPLIKDPGATINVFGQTGSTVVTNVYNFGSAGARDIRKHADIILGGLPQEIAFEAAPMILFQMRDGPAGVAGDYGIIDRFSPSPVKIRWANEDAKASIMDRPDNVFDLVYFVTGTVMTAGGSVAAYHIRRLDDVALKPDGERHG